ncbi:MAG: hypothetical protein ACP5VE_12050 [Chthonomonadales bacterium]
MIKRTQFHLLAAAVAALFCMFFCPFARGQSSPAQQKPWFENITFKGYIQLDATFPQGNSVQGSVSNFRIRRTRPTFIVPIDALTRVQIQFDVSTGKCGSGASTATVTDTYAERIVPHFGAIQFGQNLLPFACEVYEDNAALRSPLELSYAGEQLALLERDIGLFLRNTASTEKCICWEFGLLNGQGFRSADANANKTIAGRVTAPVLPWFRIGMSGLYGTYNNNGHDWDRHAAGWEFHVTASKALKLSGEFYHAKFVDNPWAATKVARFDGGYLLSESWIGSLQSIPFVRYQRTYGDLDYRSVDLGWRWQYASNQRLTAEYDIVNGHQRNYSGVRWQIFF